MAKLTFYYSTMNAGKTTLLLQTAYNYRERGLTPQLYTAKLDNRVAEGVIASRIGLKQPADVYANGTDFFREMSLLARKQKPDCVLVEEANFLTTAQVRQLAQVADDLDIPVMCYGIRTDFMGELFEGSAALFGWADILHELKTVCHCGQEATMAVRKNAQGAVQTAGPQVQIGSNDTYEVFCRKHWRELTNL